MPWISAANGNVFEVEDLDHVAKIVREAPVGKDGKPATTAWESDPRDKGAKPWKPAEAGDAGNSE